MKQLEVEQDEYKITMPKNNKERTHLIVIVGSIIAATIVLLIVILGTVLGTRPGTNDAQCYVTTPTLTTSLGSTTDFQLKFLVIGDWGRGGEYNQTALGAAMATVAQDFKPEFVISTGDNFYDNGLRSANDPQFQTSFQNVYSNAGLRGIEWYVVLGNHDYGDLDGNTDCSSTDIDSCQGDCCFSPIWQLGMGYKQIDPRWNCQRLFDMTLAEGQVYILYMDTSPFVGKYRYDAWANQPQGLNSQCYECQLKEIEYRLAMSDAPWKIVVGHHPVYSNGHHKNTTELVELLEPLLKKYNVQAYFNGHDHDLEHIKFENDVTNYITSGAGSKVRSFDVGYAFGAKFQYPLQGYVSVQMSSDQMDLIFYGLSGPLYTTTIKRV
eukprot:TRINITY_DN370_c1_g1_i2.p1 TRINITY_DN370_c1_g1~~TRINITY_DN370_c1_g1_i2.p1  ORF type:complete len:380 (-),score=61.04 TRINITY_DN370_c1_g1_i2:622-1761(-)